MIQLELTRDPSMPKCTLGVLKVEGLVLQTMERPWIQNIAGGLSGEKYISCIAEGDYRLKEHFRASGEWSLMLSNPALDVYTYPSSVPVGKEQSTRTLVLIHAGNYVHDVIGCIAVGRSRVRLVNGDWMVRESRDAMHELRMVLNNELDLRLRISRRAT